MCYNINIGNRSFLFGCRRPLNMTANWGWSCCCWRSPVSTLPVPCTPLEVIHCVVFRHPYAIPFCLCWHIFLCISAWENFCYGQSWNHVLIYFGFELETRLISYWKTLCTNDVHLCLKWRSSDKLSSRSSDAQCSNWRSTSHLSGI